MRGNYGTIFQNPRAHLTFNQLTAKGDQSWGPTRSWGRSRNPSRGIWPEAVVGPYTRMCAAAAFIMVCRGKMKSIRDNLSWIMGTCPTMSQSQTPTPTQPRSLSLHLWLPQALSSAHLSCSCNYFKEPQCKFR